MNSAGRLGCLSTRYPEVEGELAFGGWTSVDAAFAAASLREALACGLMCAIRCGDGGSKDAGNDTSV